MKRIQYFFVLKHGMNLRNIDSIHTEETEAQSRADYLNSIDQDWKVEKATYEERTPVVS